MIERVLDLHRPNDSLVFQLERLLVDAKAGRLQSLVFAGEIVGGEVVRGYTKTEDRYALVGVLECLKYLLIESIAGDAKQTNL